MCDNILAAVLTRSYSLTVKNTEPGFGEFTYRVLPVLDGLTHTCSPCAGVCGAPIEHFTELRDLYKNSM